MKDRKREDRFIEDSNDSFVFVSNNEDGHKQNMTLDGFTTTADLDRQFEAILKSIEPDVMKLAKKIPASK